MTHLSRSSFYSCSTPRETYHKSPTLSQHQDLKLVVPIQLKILPDLVHWTLQFILGLEQKNGWLTVMVWFARLWIYLYGQGKIRGICPVLWYEIQLSRAHLKWATIYSCIKKKQQLKREYLSTSYRGLTCPMVTTWLKIFYFHYFPQFQYIMQFYDTDEEWDIID